jgi:prolipoprotein diacylglyceryl transferase
MLPIISVGPLAIPAYPLFLLLAYWAGMWLAARQANRIGLDGDHIYSAGLYGLIAGIVGARLWFVLSNWESYAPDMTQAFSLSRSALSIGEGLIVAGLVVLIYLYRNKAPVGLFFDAAAPGLALAIIIANVGALLGGEWLGEPSNVPWAVEIAGTARHPIQLYEATSGLIVLGILLYLTAYRPWPGFHFWLFVTLYAGSRLILEIFRARPVLVGDGFIAAQIVALTTIVVALAVMAYHFHQTTLAKSKSTPL